MKDFVATLQRTPLFANVDQSILQAIAERGITERTYHAGEVIIVDGDHGDNFYILKRGVVTVIKRITLLNDERLGSGDKAIIKLTDAYTPFFGEMAMFHKDETRSATVMADTECIVLEIDAPLVLKMTTEHSSFGLHFYRNVSRVLAERLRKANSDIMKLTTALSIALED